MGENSFACKICGNSCERQDLKFCYDGDRRMICVCQKCYDDVYEKGDTAMRNKLDSLNRHSKDY